MCIHTESISFNSPGAEWNEALPLGNGRLGAMIFGSPNHDIVQLNEDSIWSANYRDRNNKDALKFLPKIRDLVINGQIEEAQELSLKAFTGTPSQQSVYQTAGNIIFDFASKANHGLNGPLTERNSTFCNIKNYNRTLDISKAIVNVDFES